jgi:hypothetical protein
MQSIEIIMEASKELGFTIDLLFSNTDGFMVDIDEKVLPRLIELSDEITNITNIELEYELCKSMYQANVNNFILEKQDGSVKLKGAYEIDKEMHKNHSNRIASIAAANYFINDIPIKDTIYNHLKRNKAGRFVNTNYEIYYSRKHNLKVESKGIYDFMNLIKVDKRFELTAINKDFSKTKLQKSLRYLMSNNGVKIIKTTLKTNKYSLIEAVKFAKEAVFNEMPDCDINDKEMISFEQSTNINYNYYIKEAQKLIFNIEGPSQNLLF